jgi:Methyltransferase domain
MNDNSKTVQAYERSVEAYINGGIPQVLGSVKLWVDETLQDVPSTAKILEIGSAYGRDANYIESKGFKVERSDAVDGFVKILKMQSVSSRKLDVLRGDIGVGYDVIYANAVFLHFSRDELVGVFSKVRSALSSKGKLSFSVKIGDGEEWKTAKVGEPRYFQYWNRRQLEVFIRENGFKIDWLKKGKSGHDNSLWYHIICTKT